MYPCRRVREIRTASYTACSPKASWFCNLKRVQYYVQPPVPNMHEEAKTQAMNEFHASVILPSLFFRCTRAVDIPLALRYTE